MGVITTIKNNTMRKNTMNKKRNHKRWLKSEMTALKGVSYKDAKTIRRIARTLRRTENSVYQRIYRLQLDGKSTLRSKNEYTFENFKSVVINGTKVTIKL